MQMYGMSGEQLGVIGQEQNTSPEKLPAWKQDFLAKPSASVRRGIAWGYNPPYEDTDTLVLTAPSGEFVDIRFPKDATSSQETLGHQSFWAFSGEAITTFYDAGPQQHAVDMPYTAHCKFLHNIDSRGGESIARGDVGDMFLLMNGDCVEMGKVLNPMSGQIELYKEMWCSAEELSDHDGEDDSTTCVVAHVSGPTGIEGTMIRLGGRVQGITARHDQKGTQIVEVERWIRGGSHQVKPKQHDREDVSAGPWCRDNRSSGFLPAGWLSMPGRQIGVRLERDGLVWQVTEVHRSGSE
ncbi:hypothetical protein PMZ80_008017 [Knufia obscura]|uniref:Uncharacterized protein n=1 Tax=Knufia obscura TaxID=1635080 RepID=A0ABR0RHH2_9EURO|nr:hypothetical protein PMZ80_008017 [Knufia obscura]